MTKKTLSKCLVYTIKVLMGIGGKCKDNINMADFEEYVALYVCILCTLILRRRLRVDFVLDQRECGLEPGFKGEGPEVAITLYCNS